MNYTTRYARTVLPSLALASRGHAFRRREGTGARLLRNALTASSSTRIRDLGFDLQYDWFAGIPAKCACRHVSRPSPLGGGRRGPARLLDRACTIISRTAPPPCF